MELPGKSENPCYMKSLDTTVPCLLVFIGSVSLLAAWIAGDAELLLHLKPLKDRKAHICSK